MTVFQRVVVSLAIMGVGTLHARAATLHVDAFDAAAQGWSGGGAGALHEVLGGAGDGTGYIRVPSGGNGNLAAVNADARWTGDYSAIGAGRIVLDLRVPEGLSPLELRIVLFGPSSNQQRYTSATAQTVPADGIWRKLTFSLAEADLVPTQVNVPFISHAQVMANVLQVMLRHDPGTPSHGGENVSSELQIDNATLASAPPLGDFDGNGLVNAADLSHPTLGWKARYGADLDGDDFLSWQRGLNSPGTVLIPEPASLAAMSMMAGLLIRRRDPHLRGQL